MLDPMDLVTLEPDAPLVRTPGATMLVSLGGFIDAGQVSGTVSEYLLDHLGHQVVASFDVDQLLDFRARRPPMTFDTNRWTGYDDPSLALYLLRDLEGTPFYLLRGPEPDYQWERFVAAVLGLAERLGVRLIASMHGVPMGVPHTRPVGMTQVATDPALITGQESVFGQLRMPSSMTSLLQLRTGEMGGDGLTFAVHVPQYLADAEFGDAAVAATEAFAAAAGLVLPLADLITRAGTNRAAIEAEMAQNPEVGQAVAAMEEQYDQFMAARSRRSLLAKEEAKLPSADEIGAELEAFLKRTADDDEPEAGASGDAASAAEPRPEDQPGPPEAPLG